MKPGTTHSMKLLSIFFQCRVFLRYQSKIRPNSQNRSIISWMITLSVTCRGFAKVLSIRQHNTKNKAGVLPLYIYKKDSKHGQQVNVFESLVGSTELPLDDQPVVIIMNKGNFVLPQSDVLQLTEHNVPQEQLISFEYYRKNSRMKIFIFQQMCNINSSPFPLIFRMVESNLIIPDTCISHQLADPCFDPDSETLGITEPRCEELTSSTSFRALMIRKMNIYPYQCVVQVCLREDLEERWRFQVI